MAQLRMKNNLRGDIEAFLSILLSGGKFKNKITKVGKYRGGLVIEGEIHFENE